MPAPLRLEWVESYERFAGLAGAWDALAHEDPTPFTRHGWLAAWWAAFAAERPVRVCTAWRGQELVAGLPLVARDGQLEALANFESPVFGAVARDAEARRAVLEAALAETRDKLVLRALPVDDPLLAQLRAPGTRRGRPLLEVATYESPLVEIRGDFETYRRSQRPKWMGRIAAYGRKMAREHELELDVLERPGDVTGMLAEAWRVEASGWKGKAGTAVACSPATLAFYAQMAAAFSRTGELRISRLALDGQLVAFDLGLEHRGRLFGLKTGYDERFKKLKPGLVLHLAITEACFAAGLVANEMLGEANDWKLSFATTVRPHCDATVYARRPAPLARFAYRRWVRPRLRGS